MKTNLLLCLISISFAAYGEPLDNNNAGATAEFSRLIETRVCRNCQLQNSDFSGMDLSGVDLSGANLNGSNLYQTNLRGAKLQGTSLLKVELSETALSGADLRNADLSDIDIDQVFESIEIIGAKFEGARFKEGVICGPAPIKGGWGCQQL